MTQSDIYYVCQRQPIGVNSIFDCRYIGGLANYAFCEEKTHRQFMVVSGGAHNYGQASMVDTHFKWFFDGEVILTLLLFIFAPLGHLYIHDTHLIERVAPEALSSTLTISR